MTMTKDVTRLVRPRVRGLVAYHLDRYDVPVKLDQNENTLGLPDDVRRAIVERLAKLPLNRYPTPGQPEIKRALAKATGFAEEGIIVGNGSDELLHDIAYTFLEAGRKAVAPTPSFFVYEYTARLAGAEVVEVPLTEALAYDVARIVAAVEEHAPHVTYLCSPNNPTGSVLAPEEVERIVRASSGIVVLDEAYWEFAGATSREIVDRYPNLILMRTFSKALALAGARVGYLLAAPELSREIVKVQQPYPLNRFSTEAALCVLEHPEAMRAQTERIASERDRLFEQLSAMDGVEVWPSRTNFLLFRTRLGAKTTFRGLVANGVLVRDLSAHPLLREMLRVGVGARAENDRFSEALSKTLSGGPR